MNLFIEVRAARMYRLMNCFLHIRHQLVIKQRFWSGRTGTKCVQEVEIIAIFTLLSGARGEEFK